MLALFALLLSFSAPFPLSRVVVFPNSAVNTAVTIQVQGSFVRHQDQQNQPYHLHKRYYCLADLSKGHGDDFSDYSSDSSDP